MPSDLTIIYYTANHLPERFHSRTLEHLKGVVGDLPVISVSQVPMDFGSNICIGQIGHSAWLVYWQILLGVRETKTKFVACCEDDCLYPKDHFDFVPDREAFFYNRNRLLIEIQERRPIFRYRPNRICMFGCIAPTGLMLQTLETRFARYPDPILKTYDPRLKGWGEPGRYEHYLRLPRVEMDYFRSTDCVLTFNHRDQLGGRRKRLPGDDVYTTLPYWGAAEDLWGHFYE